VRSARLARSVPAGDVRPLAADGYVIGQY